MSQKFETVPGIKKRKGVVVKRKPNGKSYFNLIWKWSKDFREKFNNSGEWNDAGTRELKIKKQQ